MIIVNIKFYFRKVIKTLQRVTLLNLVDHYTSHDISINQGLQGISPKRRLYYLLFMEPIDGSGLNINYKMAVKLSMSPKKKLGLGIFDLEIQNFAGVYNI
jgi:hypothetical protein